MSDEIDNAFNNIAAQLDAPSVDNIYAIASARKRRRTRNRALGGLAVLVVILAVGQLWRAAPEPTGLATLGNPEATTTAPGEGATDQGDQRCLEILKASDAQIQEDRETKLQLCAAVAQQSNGEPFGRAMSSPEQLNALEDGVLAAEYEAAFHRFEKCTAAAGIELELTQTLEFDGRFAYQFVDAEGRLFAHDVCYSWHYQLVDSVWQTSQATTSSVQLSGRWKVIRIEGFPLNELVGDEWLDVGPTDRPSQVELVVSDGCNQLRNLALTDQNGLRLLHEDEGGDPGVVAGVGCDGRRSELLRFAMQPQFTDLTPRIEVTPLGEDYLRLTREGLVVEIRPSAG